MDNYIYVTYSGNTVTGAFGFEPKEDYKKITVAEWKEVAKYGLENLIIVDNTVKVTDTAVAKRTLEAKVNEAKQYLIDTDFKMTADYDCDTTEVKIKRAEAREFIRANS